MVGTDKHLQRISSKWALWAYLWITMFYNRSIKIYRNCHFYFLIESSSLLP